MNGDNRPQNPLGDRLKTWWMGPMSWKVALLIALVLISMMIFPIIAVVYSALSSGQ